MCEGVRWDGVVPVEPEREPERASVEELADMLVCRGEHGALGEHAAAELRRQGLTLDDLLPRWWARDVEENDWQRWGLKPPRFARRRQERDYLGVPMLPPHVF